MGETSHSTSATINHGGIVGAVLGVIVILGSYIARDSQSAYACDTCPTDPYIWDDFTGFGLGIIVLCCSIPWTLPKLDYLVSRIAISILRVESRLVLQDPSVITKLGAINAVCADKTGVLTSHMIMVTKLTFGTGEVVDMRRKEPENLSPRRVQLRRESVMGTSDQDNSTISILRKSNYVMQLLATAICLSSHIPEKGYASFQKYKSSRGEERELWLQFAQQANNENVGINQTDAALLQWLEHFIDIGQFYIKQKDTVVKQYPFDPARRYSSVVVEDTARIMKSPFMAASGASLSSKERLHYVQVFKGAADVLLPGCTHYCDLNGQEIPLTTAARDVMHRHIMKMAGKGLRVISVAATTHTSAQLSAMLAQTTDEGSFDALYDAKRQDRAIILIGLIGIEEVLREHVSDVLQELQSASISCHVVSGDHVETALYVARTCGVPQSPMELNSQVGWRFADEWKRPESQGLAQNVHVLARATAQDKEAFVSSLYEAGKRVCVVGEGEQDLLMAHKADVSICLYNGADDGFKEVADVYVLNDDWRGIRDAFIYGRHVFVLLHSALNVHLTLGILLCIYCVSSLRLDIFTDDMDTAIPSSVSVWLYFFIIFPFWLLLMLSSAPPSTMLLRAVPASRPFHTRDWGHMWHAVGVATWNVCCIIIIRIPVQLITKVSTTHMEMMHLLSFILILIVFVERDMVSRIAGGTSRTHVSAQSCSQAICSLYGWWYYSPYVLTVMLIALQLLLFGLEESIASDTSSTIVQLLVLFMEAAVSVLIAYIGRRIIDKCTDSQMNIPEVPPPAVISPFLSPMMPSVEMESIQLEPLTIVLEDGKTEDEEVLISTTKWNHKSGRRGSWLMDDENDDSVLLATMINNNTSMSRLEVDDDDSSSDSEGGLTTSVRHATHKKEQNSYSDIHLRYLQTRDQNNVQKETKTKQEVENDQEEKEIVTLK